jgi:hypothetical protein
MRSLIIRRAVVVFLVVLVASLALTAFSSGFGSITQLGWPVALSAGIAALSGWQAASGIRKSLVDGVLADFRLVPVIAAEWPQADWQAIDDYAIQLESKGYVRLGDFTSNAPQKATRGFARFLADPQGTRIVEIQHFERVAMPAGLMDDDQFTIHFTLTSILGGRIRVQASDRPALPVFYVLRGDTVAAATFPGRSLLELLEKHAQLARYVAERSGKRIDSGFTLERYVGLEREKFASVRRRLQAAGGWAIAGQWDAFVAAPRTHWSPSEKTLRALPARGWDEVDALAAGAVSGGPEAPVERADPALRERMLNGAHWFYWIAGLSLVNAIASAFGSSWGFVIGLGFTQVLDAIAQAAAQEGGIDAGVGMGALVVNALVIAGFALIGWLATRPSVAAFAVGIALFAFDTLIFLVAGDWIGIAFHGLALYFLWTGLAAARAMKRAAARSA